MQTMHPSIMLGSYIWLQDRLPIDEFRLRLDDIFEEMDKHGWKGLLVYGDAREHAALAYVSNFIPRMRWGMALISRDGNHRLLCSMSTRDLPAMRTMTWIGDVHSGWEWEKTFDPWLQQFKSNAVVELGTVGLDLMAPVLKTSLDRSIGDRFRLSRADEVLTLPLPRKRPREISMIRASCRVVEAAAKAFIEGWRASGAPETGALQGERAARAMAAQDVRTLVSLNGGRTLVPFQGEYDKVPGPLLGIYRGQAGRLLGRHACHGRGGCHRCSAPIRRRARPDDRRGAAGDTHVAAAFDRDEWAAAPCSFIPCSVGASAGGSACRSTKAPPSATMKTLRSRTAACMHCRSGWPTLRPAMP